MIKTIKIPQDRVAVLIGKRGTTKRAIQKKTGTKILIGEEITIEGESLNVLDAENIIKAIGRGFSPEKTSLLLEEDTTLLMVELPKNEQTAKRIRSRLIGTNGKSRRNLERLTRTHVSVYGKTVCVIGKYSNAALAEEAINKIIKGVSHRFVYEFLEGKQDGLE
jgi:ribosomal RNA assembly protein